VTLGESETARQFDEEKKLTASMAKFEVPA
jgi:hypothetical protein